MIFSSEVTGWETPAQGSACDSMPREPSTDEKARGIHVLSLPKAFIRAGLKPTHYCIIEVYVRDGILSPDYVGIVAKEEVLSNHWTLLPGSSEPLCRLYPRDAFIPVAWKMSV